MKLTRNNAILPFTPNNDLTGKEGYAAMYYHSVDRIDIYDELSGEPLGVIVHGTDTTEKTSIALFAGGLAGTVKVKLGSSVNAIGTNLWIDDNGTFHPTPVSGPSFISAKALETGASGELVEAVLFRPEQIII